MYANVCCYFELTETKTSFLSFIWCSLKYLVSNDMVSWRDIQSHGMIIHYLCIYKFMKMVRITCDWFGMLVPLAVIKIDASRIRLLNNILHDLISHFGFSSKTKIREIASQISEEGSSGFHRLLWQYPYGGANENIVRNRTVIG